MRISPSLSQAVLSPAVLFVAAAAGGSVSAQSADVTVPALAASHEGNDIASYPFGWTQFRTQQLIEARAITSGRGLISALQFRPDTSNSSGSAAVRLPDVLIQMVHTSMPVSMMDVTFDLNYSGRMQEVYRGPVDLPAWSSASGDVAPWFMIPLQVPFHYDSAVGNLLIDIRSADPSGTASRSGWIPDSALPGGAMLGYGDGPSSGQLSDGVRMSAYGSGPAGRFSGLVAGNSVQISASSQFTPWSGHMLMGFDRLPQSADLASIGGLGSLHIQSALALPFTMSRPPIGFGYQARWTLQVPSDPAVVGASLHLQPVVQDAAGGSLGLVAFRAAELVIGDSAPHPIRQVNSSDLSNPVGRYQYTSGIPGGAVIRLLGAFD